MLFKELGIIPSFGVIEPNPCERQREILSWGLAFMHTLDSLKMAADRAIRTDRINSLTTEQLLGDMSPHDLASEKALARSRNIDPDEHLRAFAENRRAAALKALEREWNGETDEEPAG